MRGTGLAAPPCNIGPRSTPDYGSLADAAVTSLRTGETVFAGQRAEGFYVDLGSVFDLATLRPFQNLHVIPTASADGVDALANANVHSLAVQVPIAHLTRDGSVPRDPMAASAVIGVWGAASRQKALVRDGDGDGRGAGPWVQVSRLGNPLFNEVIVPLARKDAWNAQGPDRDSRFARFVARPELARLLPQLYPGVFPNLAALDADRADLVAVLLTGIPAGLIDGFQNFTGHPGRRSCASTSPSHRRTNRAAWASSAVTWPASPTAGGSATTWSRSSCGRSPGPPTPDRPGVHARRGRVGDRGRHVPARAELPRPVPVPRPALQRL